MIFSCSDEESFGTSTSLRLTFSDDTVSFDTILSTIGTSTKRVRVFNNQSEGIRITNVRLGSGGTSGFRINVNGKSGPSVDNVEVLKKDSIFMFIDIIPEENASDSPTEIKDSVIFTLESGIQQQMILTAYGQDVTILKGQVYKAGENGIIGGSDKPYLIYDSIKVDSGATLTIEAGAKLYLHSGVYILVDGTLKINGTEEKPVLLRGDRTDNMFPYLPYDRIDGQWGGIYYSSQSTGNIITYADIHGGDNALLCDESGTEKSKLTVSNSVIHNFNGYCLLSTNNQITFEHSQISNARKDCLNLTGGVYNFNHCTIAQFNRFHSERGKAFYGYDFTYNEKGDSVARPLYVTMRNSIVTGYSDKDQITIDHPYSKSDMILSFDYCLLRTDTTGMNNYISMPVTNTIFDIDDNEVSTGGNFKTIDFDNYIFDFHLDSLSQANGKAEGGKNIGCYQ